MYDIHLYDACFESRPVSQLYHQCKHCNRYNLSLNNTVDVAGRTAIEEDDNKEQSDATDPQLELMCVLAENDRIWSSQLHQSK